MGKIVGAVLFGIIALACFVMSYLQFHEKGFLLNNGYLYAPQQERKSMDKKPYYKQSGIAFVCVGLIFSINAVEILLQTGWLFYLVIGVAVAAISLCWKRRP